jgi:hypothetical protein
MAKTVVIRVFEEDRDRLMRMRRDGAMSVAAVLSGVLVPAGKAGDQE